MKKIITLPQLRRLNAHVANGEISASKMVEIINERAEKLEPILLFDFFMWFRENGEKHLDVSVEKMIEIYLNESANN